MSRIKLSLFLVFISLFSVMSATAQTDEQELIVIEGRYMVAQSGIILVDGYIITLAEDVTVPEVPVEGSVIVTGYLMDDGVTIEAVSIELDEDTDENNGRGSSRASRNSERGSETGDGANIYCTDSERQHPVAERIAGQFDVDYAEIIEHFCTGGYGFGQITMAYRLAAASGESVEAVFELRDSGMGWGRIVKDLGLHPRDVMGGGNGRGRGNGRGNGRGSDRDS